MHPAVSANPYLSFYATADKSGEMHFVWTDDDGSTLETRATIEVKP
jgi:sulfur-oxidizing protein SoxZ